MKTFTKKTLLAAVAAAVFAGGIVSANAQQTHNYRNESGYATNAAPTQDGSTNAVYHSELSPARNNSCISDENDRTELQTYHPC